MATFYRIEKERRAAEAFHGLGGLHSDGRWHRRGRPVAYASEHPALAVLEKLAWLGSFEDAVAGSFVVIAIKVPRKLIETVPVGSLPDEWATFPHPAETQALGARWLEEARTVALEVPSAVMPSASNVLINPLHVQMRSLTVGDPEPFRWDPRLFA